MPRYDIYCVDCNKRYEIEKSYNDLSPMTCPNGHKRIVRKITKPTKVIYKGDGFTKKVEDDQKT